MIEVDLHYKRNSTGPVEAILRSSEELLKLGFKLNNKGEKPVESSPKRLLVSQQFFLNSQVLDANPRIVMLERADASISWCRRETKHPHVKKVVKISTLRPAILNNHCWGRYHSWLLDASSTPEVRVPLDPFTINKIVPGASYAAYNVMKRWIDQTVSFKELRPYTVHFAGTTTYGDRHEISNHRLSALKAVRRIPGQHVMIDGRHIPRQEYDTKMLGSRIVLSPWGFGETAYRDYEALYAGAVLIKPESSFVNSWPDVFINGVRYIPCKPDWSDLKEKVAYVNDHWKELEEMRFNNRNLLLNHWKEPVIANHYAMIFREAWNAQ